MANSRIPGGFKVGRSRDVERRRAHLQCCQSFRMQLVATFVDAGWAETAVHARLAHSHVREGPGREWFKVSLSEVLFAIGKTLEPA